MKIYVASSWRNHSYEAFIKILRKTGYQVYDFKNPDNGVRPFTWLEIDPNWENWTGEQFRKALSHPLPEAAFRSDMTALRECDVCILLLPCGRSAHMEAGWAAGAGKPVIVYLADRNEPELTYKMTPFVCVQICEVLECMKYLASSEHIPETSTQKPTSTNIAPSLQDAVEKGLITQHEADEFHRLVESGDIIELLATAEMTIINLREKLNEAITAIREGLEEFTDYDDLRTCMEFILEELQPEPSACEATGCYIRDGEIEL